ncbi:MAG: membrane dipeptidase, partial [Saprospiraceae bacterium]|nr:membrane dipeptidase [Saprospiraceae bacterium]
KKIIIDLAHASPTLIDDILDITNRPLVVSHTGVKGTYESPRNLSDNHIKRIAERGGLIGIGFWDGAVGSPDIENIVKAIRYTIDLTGLDHVALGSDWDGGTTTYFDAAHISILTQALMDANFSNEEIRKVMGLNQLRFFLENLP